MGGVTNLLSAGKRKKRSDEGSSYAPCRMMVVRRDQHKDTLDKDTEVVSVGLVQKIIQLNPSLFKDKSVSVGGIVKAKGEVLREHSGCTRRPPNMNCRIESFGRICQKFDDRRIKWVYEMGFGGLLYFAYDMHLLRQLSYWLMTRVDPLSRVFITPDGRELPLSKNQVRWVLGIPSGSKAVPGMKMMTPEVRGKVQHILLKYGKTWETKSCRDRGMVYTSIGIPVTSKMKDRLESHFEENEEEEFKTLFLIIALQMVLCPTQSPRLASDLLPALGCVMDSCDYDWCELLLSKLMDSVASFSRRFYANGYAGGCGGCSIFVVIFYLDRLNRDPIQWGVYPRIKAWSMQHIRKAGRLDRVRSGDYGSIGLVDVAYGEKHPKEARDTEAPPAITQYSDLCKSVVQSKDRRRSAPKGGQRVNYTGLGTRGIHELDTVQLEEA